MFKQLLRMLGLKKGINFVAAAFHLGSSLRFSANLCLNGMRISPNSEADQTGNKLPEDVSEISAYRPNESPCLVRDR